MNGFEYCTIIVGEQGKKHCSDIIKLLDNSQEFRLINVIEYQTENTKSFCKDLWGKKVPHDSFCLGTQLNIYILQKDLQSLTPEETSSQLLALQNTINHKFASLQAPMAHVLDSPRQVQKLLPLMGFTRGIFDITIHSNLLIDATNRFENAKSFTLKKVGFEELFANLVQNGQYSLVKIEDTPHYQTAKHGTDAYKKYLDNFRGKFFCKEFANFKFLKLIKTLDYLSHEHTEYIYVEKIPAGYKILDGVHRSSILRARGKQEVIVVEVEL